MTAHLFGASRAGPPVLYLPGWAKGVVGYDELLREIPFDRANTTMYGRPMPVPRRECWFGLRPYSYGGQVRQPRAMPPLVDGLRERVEAELDIRSAARRGDGMGRFDSCFVNEYETGKDSISWHADDEDWIGPVVASLTFWGPRKFSMKLKYGTGKPRHWQLGDGDLFVMLAGCQDDWLHSIRKTQKPVDRRMNLTFRSTVGNVQGALTFRSSNRTVSTAPEVLGLCEHANDPRTCPDCMEAYA